MWKIEMFDNEFLPSLHLQVYLLSATLMQVPPFWQLQWANSIDVSDAAKREKKIC